jgi:hypothetical protein
LSFLPGKQGQQDDEEDEAGTKDGGEIMLDQFVGMDVHAATSDAGSIASHQPQVQRCDEERREQDSEAGPELDSPAMEEVVALHEEEWDHEIDGVDVGEEAGEKRKEEADMPEVWRPEAC